MSSTQVAAALVTTVARVDRAARGGWVEVERDDRGRWRFAPSAVEALARRWGVAPRVDGLDPQSLFVLAAVSRHPGGLASARAVARVAGISPTTAVSRLAALEDRGLIRQRTWRTAAGRAIDQQRWEADWTAPAWTEVAPAVAATRLPRANGERLTGGVPARFGHLFWNVDLDDVDPDEHGAYIAGRVLDTPDSDALAWAVRRLTAADWRVAAARRGTRPPRRALAESLSERPARWP